jgi:hypothetical protein
MVRLVLLSSLLLVILWNSGCEWINPEEDLPSYIRIDSVGFDPGPHASLGSAYEITEVWVYINGILQGIYPLPAYFPVLDTGLCEIDLKAGIRKNGIAASRAVYPFYQTVTINHRLVALETSTFYPVFEYQEEILIPWAENFEDAGIGLDTTLSSQVPLEQVEEGGNSLGLFTIPEKLLKAECVSLSSFDLPTNAPVFLEMEYRNSMNFTVGLNIFNPGTLVRQPVISLFPKEEWTKIYIDLSYFATLNSTANGFTLFIGGIKTDSTVTGQIRFDNLKIVHF